jgi:hypothetical protein
MLEISEVSASQDPTQVTVAVTEVVSGQRRDDKASWIQLQPSVVDPQESAGGNQMQRM